MWDGCFSDGLAGTCFGLNGADASDKPRSDDAERRVLVAVELIRQGVQLRLSGARLAPLGVLLRPVDELVDLRQRRRVDAPDRTPWSRYARTSA